MKKIYETPQTSCYDVELESMIAASGITDITGADGVDVGNDTDVDNILDANSRLETYFFGF